MLLLTLGLAFSWTASSHRKQLVVLQAQNGSFPWDASTIVLLARALPPTLLRYRRGFQPRFPLHRAGD